MTQNDADDDREREDEPRKVKDISHTHPHHDEPFGATGTYDRGGDETAGEADEETEAEDEDADDPDPRVTDGGHRGSDEDRDEDDGDSSPTRRKIGDRDHTPPDGVGAQDAYERGREGRDDAV